MHRFRYCRFAVFLCLTSLAWGQHYRPVPKERIEQRLSAAVEMPKQSERGEYLRQQFAAAGCAPQNLRDDAVKHEKAPNIICVVPGKSARQIVVGAHYDFVSNGRGIVDNWSGASLLPSLLESLNNEPREHTLVFLAFTGEEDGLVGSKSYVEHLTKEQRQAISAMVNIDTLGLTPTKVWEAGSSKSLVSALFWVANEVKSPLAIVDVEKAGTSDNMPFREAKIPEICIHSITRDTWHILHSKDDQLNAIRMDDYYESYRLLAVYLAVIDRDLDSPEEKQAPQSTLR